MGTLAKHSLWKKVDETLPDGALSCEYIEATSSEQKVNTGILVSQKLQIILCGQMIFPSSYYQEIWLFGAWGQGHEALYDRRSYLIGCYQDSLRSEAGPDISQYWGIIN